MDLLKKKTTQPIEFITGVIPDCCFSAAFRVALSDVRSYFNLLCVLICCPQRWQSPLFWINDFQAFQRQRPRRSVPQQMDIKGEETGGRISHQHCRHLCRNPQTKCQQAENMVRVLKCAGKERMGEGRMGCPFLVSGIAGSLWFLGLRVECTLT